MQSCYALLLNDRLKTLGHFADQPLQATSDYDFFCNLCLNCIPFIKRVSLLQPLLNSWDKELQDYHKNWRKIEKEAIHQVTNTYNLIKQRLSSTQLIQNQEINDKLKSIECILNGEERNCLQSHYEIANDRIHSLLQGLFNMGEEKILADLVNIFYPDKNEKKSNPAAKSYIQSFSFSPAISNLQALSKKKSRDNLHVGSLG